MFLYVQHQLFCINNGHDIYNGKHKAWIIIFRVSLCFYPAMERRFKDSSVQKHNPLTGSKETVPASNPVVIKL